MKILQLRFSNLNSLAGEWFIDFKDAAYLDGIFAIVGPTGAGKTTLLDAISLALYGRTPRLSAIGGKSGNEIMSRGAGDCFAEVTFLTQVGVFRSHWSQARARKKAEGQLQPVKHEVVDVTRGKILFNKIKEVLSFIEKLTGMDFERFTRSMLLAQGEFAAFLQASPDERSPILEQITGTEIYSRISVLVHERKILKKRLVDDLSKELSSVQLLNSEETESLNKKLFEYEGKNGELTSHIKQLRVEIGRHEKILSLQKEIFDISTRQRTLAEKIFLFTPDSLRLDFGKKASRLEFLFTNIIALRDRQSLESKELEKAKEALPNIENQNKEAMDLLINAENDLQKKRKDLEEKRVLFAKVRELDILAGEKLKLCETEQKKLTAKKEAFEKLKDRLNFSQQQVLDLTSEISGLEKLCKETEEDKSLESHFAGVQAKANAIQQLFKQVELKKDKYKTLELDGKKIEETRKNIIIEFEKKRKNYYSVKEKIKITQETLDSKLQGKSFEEWLEKQNFLRERKRSVNLILTDEKNILGLNVAIEKQREKIKEIESQCNSIADELKVKKERQNFLEKEKGLLDTQFILLQTIANFEEQRLKLVTGSPCPLCGAIEHPYATRAIPSSSETELQVKQVEEELSSVIKSVNNDTVKVARLQKDDEQAQLRLRELEEKYNTLIQSIKESRHTLNISFEVAIEDILSSLQQEISETTAVIAQVGSLNKEQADLQKEDKRLSNVLEEDKGMQQKLAIESATIKNSLELSQSALEEVEKQYAYQWQDLLKEFALYQLSPANLMEIDVCIDTLKKRNQLYQSRVFSLREKKSKKEELISLSKNFEDQLNILKQEIGEIEKNNSMLVKEYQLLQDEREKFFAKNSVDEAEQIAQKDEKEADSLVKKQREFFESTKQSLSLHIQKIKQMETSLEKISSKLIVDESKFTQALGEQGFLDELSFCSARLEQEELDLLAQKREELSNDSTILQSSMSEKQEKLASLKEEKEIVELPILLEQEKQDTEEIEKILQEVGVLRDKLTTSNTLKQQQKKSIARLQNYQKEYEQWSLLNELIGSHDGKKFRNFAQGLTFEVMVAFANKQLKKMTDRYTLVRDIKQPLELNVIDAYQAGEVRSSKNLSGGESFIVSMALALGLSNMASKTIRIDSLFLDEGFGSLDEETLETALETLSTLHQSGKLIGVISHIGALKERIRTQIEVIPLSGGKSKLQGPGCLKK